MEYRAINIDLHRERFYSKVSTENLSGKGKEVLESQVSIRICVFGIPVQDAAFPFELKAILEEFTAKKLGQVSGPLNSNHQALGHGYVLVVGREGNQLVFRLKAPDTRVYASRFDMIHAKTLYSILSKALQTVTI